MNSKCFVRSLEDDDLLVILEWRNHPETRRFMLTGHKITEEEHLKWFAKSINDPKRSMVIIEDEIGPFGFVQFNNVADNGIANWGFYVAPESPKGSGLRLGIEALRYAFETLKVSKVEGKVLDFNKASISYHLRLGFNQEGVTREHYKVGDKHHSLVCFGLEKSDWRSAANVREFLR